MSATAGTLCLAPERIRRLADAQETAGRWTPDQQRLAICARTNLQRLSRLTISSRPSPARLTALSFLVPVPPTQQQVWALLDAGVGMIRLPSTTPAKDLKRAIKAIRTAAASRNCPVAVAIDICRTELHTGAIYKGKEMNLISGDDLYVTNDPETASQENVIYIEYPDISKGATSGDRIRIDDGLITMQVKEVGYGYAFCRVEIGGVLRQGQAVTMPGIPKVKPLTSDKEKAILREGIRLGVDVVVVPYVRCVKAVHQVRDHLQSAEFPLVFSVIEEEMGFNNANKIIAASDGLIVCSFDFADTISMAAVLAAQKSLVARCRLAGKPVMVTSKLQPRLTTPEVNNIANTVLDGADGLFFLQELSPSHADVIDATCREAEAARWEREERSETWEVLPQPLMPSTAIATGAAEAAGVLGAVAMVVVTTKGRMAKMLSRCRPRCPVVAVTRCRKVAASCQHWFSLLPLHYRQPPIKDWKLEMESRVKAGLRLLEARGIGRPDDKVVILHPSFPDTGFCNTLRIIELGEIWPDMRIRKRKPTPFLGPSWYNVSGSSISCHCQEESSEPCVAECFRDCPHATSKLSKYSKY